MWFLIREYKNGCKTKEYGLMASDLIEARSKLGHSMTYAEEQLYRVNRARADARLDHSLLTA